jgi:ligand-binding SRPBCC domain-containing protein
MFTIKETIEVNAPMARVWGIFARMNDWKNWNSACENCRLESGSEIAEGVCFNFMLRPYYLPMKVTPKVIHQAEHTFYFNEENSKVTVTSVEVFKGLMLIVGKLLFIPSKLHRLTQKMMAELKEHAESSELY